MKLAFSLFILSRSFHICFALTLPLEQKTQIIPIIGRWLYTKYKHIKCYAFSIFFYAIRLLQSIFFCLHHDTNAIYLVSYFLSLYSKKINRRGRKIESEKNQKQNKTVYRLCSYRLVICFIGSAIAHGALKAADILLTYVFM